MSDDSAPPVTQNAGSADPVSAVIATLRREGAPQEIIQARLESDVLTSASESAMRSEAILDRIIDELFPDGLVADGFYRELAQIEFKLGWSNEAQKLSGAVWARFFARLGSIEQQRLLAAMLDPGTDFFSALQALPTFLQRSTIPSDLLAEWLVGIRNKLGNDMASGGFWNGLQSLTDTFPHTAFAIVQKLTAGTLDDIVITMIAVMLGHLRLVDSQPPGLADFQKALSAHPDVNRRLIFHRSWITTALCSPLSDDQFRQVLERMTTGTSEELSEAFNFIRCLLASPSISDNSFALSSDWLVKHTSSTVSDFWKHFVLSVARTSYPRWKATATAVPPIYNLAITIQPVPAKNTGTWRELEQLLLTLLRSDQGEFRRILFGVARANPGGFLQRLRSFEEFNELAPALRTDYGTELITEALLSKEDAVRNLGFTLFDITGSTALHLASLTRASNNAVAIIIFAFRLQPFYDDVIPRFLLAIVPRISRATASLKDLFVQEMVFQCKNLPGACLKALKKRSRRNVLVRRAVTAAEAYFERLKPADRSAINSMGVPGLDRAMRLRAVRESRAMSAQVKEKSVFTQLFATSYTLYGGTRWQTFFGGKLGDVSEMKQISHSAELPRMPSIDPDGMAQRAHEASRMTRHLLDALESGGND